MDNFLGRAILVAIFVPIAMHGIGYGVESNGGAYRSNPAWRLIQAYFDFEKGVIELILFFGAVALAAWILMTFVNHWMDQKEQARKDALDESKKLEAQRKAQAEQREKEDREYFEEQIALNKKHASVEMKQVQALEEPQPQIKIITPDELKRRAIEQFKRGN